MENYKKKDKEAISDYLNKEKRAEVGMIACRTGAEPLRVYPILYELERQGTLRVTRRNEFGTPEEVEWEEGQNGT